MAEERPQKADPIRFGVQYEVVAESEIPRGVRAGSEEIQQLVLAAVHAARQGLLAGGERRRVRIRHLGGRTATGLMSAVTGFAKRHPEIVYPWIIRTRRGPDGTVYVWGVSAVKTQGELLSGSDGMASS